MEPTILRYTKNGRWFELHLTQQMRSMFGYVKGDTFEDMTQTDLHSIIHNFHLDKNACQDVTQEVAEEVENEGYAFHLLIA